MPTNNSTAYLSTYISVCINVYLFGYIYLSAYLFFYYGCRSTLACSFTLQFNPSKKKKEKREWDTMDIYIYIFFRCQTSGKEFTASAWTLCWHPFNEFILIWWYTFLTALPLQSATYSISLATVKCPWPTGNEIEWVLCSSHAACRNKSTLIDPFCPGINGRLLFPPSRAIKQTPSTKLVYCTELNRCLEQFGGINNSLSSPSGHSG